MANIVTENITTNSVHTYVAELDTSYSRNDRYIYWIAQVSGDPTQIHAEGTSYLNAYVPQGGYITLSGLQPFTPYLIVARVYYTDGSGTWYTKILFANFTTLGSSRPPLFYWNSYGASPTSSTTTLFLPKASALNALSNNIRAVQAYKNRSQTAFPTILTGQSFVNLLNQQSGEINALHGWSYLSTIGAGQAPSSNYILSMQTYINMVT